MMQIFKFCHCCLEHARKNQAYPKYLFKAHYVRENQHTAKVDHIYI